MGLTSGAESWSWHVYGIKQLSILTDIWTQKCNVTRSIFHWLLLGFRSGWNFLAFVKQLISRKDLNVNHLSPRCQGSVAHTVNICKSFLLSWGLCSLVANFAPAMLWVALQVQYSYNDLVHPSAKWFHFMTATDSTLNQLKSFGPRPSVSVGAWLQPWRVSPIFAISVSKKKSGDLIWDKTTTGTSNWANSKSVLQLGKHNGTLQEVQDKKNWWARCATV